MNISPLFIREADVKDQFDWREAVSALRAGHGLARAEIGDLFLGSESEKMLNRAAFIDGLGYAMKSVTVFAENAQAGWPSVQGAMLYFDAEHGALLAVIESDLITQIKTAADSVLGAQFLAKEAPKRLLVIGAGRVAQALIAAYCACFENLERVEIWARRFEAADELARKCGDARVRAVASLEAAVAEADIVSSATMAREPILFGDWVEAGTHIDLIGAFKADMREADDALLRKGRVFVDSFETTLEHIGELKIPLQAGVIAREDVLGDFYDLVSDPKLGREAQTDVTVFKNGGGAHLDLMIARYLYDLALSEVA